MLSIPDLAGYVVENRKNKMTLEFIRTQQYNFYYLSRKNNHKLSLRFI